MIPLRRRHITFGYDRFRQLPIVIGTPGGQIVITREPPHNVRVDFHGDGARFAGSIGQVKAEAGTDTVTVRIIHEEVKR